MEPGYRGCVAQVSNLLYRRPPVGRLYLLGGIGGLEIRDTAGWKPALHRPAGETREISGLRLSVGHMVARPTLQDRV